jgi:hypothetical protein
MYKPLPSDDPRQRQPDITLAKKELGWQPKVALQDGLEKTIAYFEGLLESSPRKERYIEIVRRERRTSVRDRRVANIDISAKGFRDERSGTSDRRAAIDNDTLRTLKVVD